MNARRPFLLTDLFNGSFFTTNLLGGSQKAGLKNNPYLPVFLGYIKTPFKG
jgi:hypothetical protein